MIRTRTDTTTLFISALEYGVARGGLTIRGTMTHGITGRIIILITIGHIIAIHITTLRITDTITNRIITKHTDHQPDRWQILAQVLQQEARHGQLRETVLQ